MIVIADTTPLNYLVLIGHQEVLGRMFGQVLIPPAVYSELQAEQTPEPVKKWLQTMPTWLEVRPVQLSADPALLRLDAGEREAILLAQEVHADLLLLDERVGRREARLRNVPVIGTLGLLERAAERGLLDLSRALADLQQTSFYISAEVMRDLIERHVQKAPRQRGQGDDPS